MTTYTGAVFLKNAMVKFASTDFANQCTKARLVPDVPSTTVRTLVPDGRLDPFSIVCKVVSADGRPAVKLSDNPMKAMGPPTEIARYRRVFEVGQQAPLPVAV